MANRTHPEKYRLKYTQTIANFVLLYICTFCFSSLTQIRSRSIGTKFFACKKIKKYSHNFDHSTSPILSVTKYSHNSPDFFRLSSESARIYKCQAEREAGKQKHFIKTRTSKINKKSDIKRRKNNDRYDEHGN